MDNSSGNSSIIDMLSNAGLAELASNTSTTVSFATVAIELIRAASSVRDKMLYKKLARFCDAAASTSDEEKMRFALQLTHDAKFREKVGEFLFTSLDRLDDQRKAEMLGQVFRALLERRDIEWEHFERIGRALAMLYYTDLVTFIKKGSKNEAYIQVSLSNAGFLQPGGSFIGGKQEHQVTELGKIFRNVMLSKI